MAEVIQLFGVVGRTGVHWDVPYLIRGVADLAAAKAAANSGIPSTFDSLPLSRKDNFRELTDTDWQCTARFESPDYPDGLPSSTKSFRSSGGTENITQSLSTIGSYSASTGTAPNLKGAIGYDGENVQGVAILTPVQERTETHWKYAASITSTYISTASGLVGTVNNADFRGRAAGSVLLMGFSAEEEGDSGEWRLTFDFGYQPNQTGLSVGDITGIAKTGWDYLWIRYAETVDADEIVPQPAYAYVERVYRSGDFSGLDIGTAWF